MPQSLKRFIFYCAVLVIWSFIVKDMIAIFLMISVFALSELINISENTKNKKP